MRIALVTEAASGGVGRHVDLLARGLKKLGEDPVVFFSPRRAAPWFERNLTEANVPAIQVDVQRHVGFGDVRSFFSLRGEMAAHGKFDVVHGHSSKAGALVRALTGSSSLRVYSPHAFVTLDRSLPAPLRLLYELAERCMAPRTDLLIATSSDELREGARLGYNGKRIRMVANGIDPPEFLARDAARAELGIPENAVCLGFIGRFTPQKRPLRLIEVAGLLPTTPAFHIAMIGGGDLAGAVDQRVAESGLEAQITVCESNVAWKYMSAFDVLVMTSAYEGMPYVLVEALYAGLPIVTDEIGGVNELVEEGVNGYVAPDGSSAEVLAALLSRLIDNPELRHCMGAQSKARSLMFSKDRTACETVAAYHAAQGVQPGPV